MPDVQKDAYGDDMRLEELMLYPDNKYKDRVFRMLFNNKQELMDLYNAINNTTYDNPEELQITTLENAIYLGMKNDVSFLIDSRLQLYEHQSTWNPNLPYRDLLYVADTYSKLIPRKEIYGSKKIMLPPPTFLMFYNGKEKKPERYVMKLSELYQPQTKEANLDLTVLVLNINKGYNESIKRNCKTLQEYTLFVEQTREYEKNMDFRQAVSKAVDTCIEQGVLKEFLLKNKAEVIKMSLYEYDAEEVRQLWEEEARERGLEKGLKEGRAEGRAEGRKEGIGIGEIRGAIKVYREFGKTEEEILKKLQESFVLTEEEAREYLSNI